MPPSTYEALTILILFFIPGFIVDSIVDRFIVRATRTDAQRLLRIIAYSALNYALLSPFIIPRIPFLIGLYRNPGEQSFDFYPDGLFTIFTLLILPVVIGILIAYVTQGQALTRIATAVNLGTNELTPKAWDVVFGQGNAYWVIIETDDGKRHAGIFVPKSYVSSYPEPEDIYIEELWRLDEEGNFDAKIPGSKGAHFRGDKIRTIYFYASEEDS